MYLCELCNYVIVVNYVILFNFIFKLRIDKPKFLLIVF